jgi:Holliday junction resolvasome RuvABC DNA-binding subunit
MGVDRLPSGSYRARLMVDGQKYSATFATEPEAADWMAVTRGRAVGARAARRLTLELLGSVAERVHRHGRQHRPTTSRPVLGARPLVEVSPAEIAKLLEQVEADTSGDVADQVRATLRELFVDAVDERLIARSPVPAS